MSRRRKRRELEKYGIHDHVKAVPVDEPEVDEETDVDDAVETPSAVPVPYPAAPAPGGRAGRRHGTRRAGRDGPGRAEPGGNGRAISRTGTAAGGGGTTRSMLLLCLSDIHGEGAGMARVLDESPGDRCRRPRRRPHPPRGSRRGGVRGGAAARLGRARARGSRQHGPSRCARLARGARPVAARPGRHDRRHRLPRPRRQQPDPVRHPVRGRRRRGPAGCSRRPGRRWPRRAAGCSSRTRPRTAPARPRRRARCTSGRPWCGSFLESHDVDLCLCGHIHEAGGRRGHGRHGALREHRSLQERPVRPRVDRAGGTRARASPSTGGASDARVGPASREDSMTAKEIAAVATSVRCLTMDAVEKAKSGHPGLPMGCAELGALLYGEILKHRPRRSRVDRPGPVRAVGRPRLHAPLLAAAPRGLRRQPRRPEVLPPARLEDARASRVGPHARRRGHGRSPRAGPRQRGGHGDRRADARGPVQHAGARRDRPPHVRPRGRRRHDGGRRVRGGLARRAPRPRAS